MGVILFKWNDAALFTRLYCVGLCGCQHPESDETCQRNAPLLLASHSEANMCLHVSIRQANVASTLSVTWSSTKRISPPAESSAHPHLRPRWCVLSVSSFLSPSPSRTRSSAPWCCRLSAVCVLIWSQSTWTLLGSPWAGDCVGCSSCIKKMMDGQQNVRWRKGSSR